MKKKKGLGSRAERKRASNEKRAAGTKKMNGGGAPIWESRGKLGD